MSRINMTEAERQSFVDHLFNGGLSDKIDELISDAVHAALRSEALRDSDGLDVEALVEAAGKLNILVDRIQSSISDAQGSLSDANTATGYADGSLEDMDLVANDIDGVIEDIKKSLNTDTDAP